MKMTPGTITGAKAERRPEWLKKKIDFDKNHATHLLINTLSLNTVCTEAKCPNISECFKNAQATFLILGKYCTRHCAFCNVEKKRPQGLDNDEPLRVAQAIKKMGLKHAVITSVTRDDLADGGAAVFAETVEQIKKIAPETTIELLIPDLQAAADAIKKVVQAKPRIIGHNLETVKRLYALRPEAGYERSLSVLKQIKKMGKDICTKSAMLLGLGEKESEVLKAMEDLRKVDCDFLALGQYLRPSLKNTPVVEYIRPERFKDYKQRALLLGFRHVESAPYVRSSYLADKYLF